MQAHIPGAIGCLVEGLGGQEGPEAIEESGWPRTVAEGARPERRVASWAQGLWLRWEPWGCGCLHVRDPGLRCP